MAWRCSGPIRKRRGARRHKALTLGRRRWNQCWTRWESLPRKDHQEPARVWRHEGDWSVRCWWMWGVWRWAKWYCIVRSDYSPRYPYLDEPQTIGYGATISAPWVEMGRGVPHDWIWWLDICMDMRWRRCRTTWNRGWNAWTWGLALAIWRRAWRRWYSDGTDSEQAGDDRKMTYGVCVGGAGRAGDRDRAHPWARGHRRAQREKAACGLARERQDQICRGRRASRLSRRCDLRLHVTDCSGTSDMGLHLTASFFSHVGAAASERPRTLLEQLKAPGMWVDMKAEATGVLTGGLCRLFAPVGSAAQSIWIYTKDSDGAVQEDEWLGVMVSVIPGTEARGVSTDAFWVIPVAVRAADRQGQAVRKWILRRTLFFFCLLSQPVDTTLLPLLSLAAVACFFRA